MIKQQYLILLFACFDNTTIELKNEIIGSTIKINY